MCRSDRFLLLSLVSLLIACEKEVEETPLRYTNIDSGLWSYMESFEYEAQKRGYTIDLESLNLEGQIEEIDEDHVLGTCHYSSQRPNLITIDESFWKSSSTLSREFVVFHELGHCVLGRGHRETQTVNGLCVSLMQSGLGSCRLLYNDQNRSLYLDELFDPGSF